MSWLNAGTNVAGLAFTYHLLHQFIPDFLTKYLLNLKKRVMDYFFPYVTITFHEYSSKSRYRYKRSQAFTFIETYLGSKSTQQSRRLKADLLPKQQSLFMTMDDSEEITDVFAGVEVKWLLTKEDPETPTFSWYPKTDNEKRWYTLTFSNKHREIVTKDYLEFVMKEGKEIGLRNRQKRLYTNTPDDGWSNIVFEHPANFQTLGIDTKTKQEIIDDLVAFTKGKEYYAKIGKPWKRGYLLYGPPGTGKSSMIAAMANFLNYNIYDIELASVKDNTELRTLLTGISSRSIIVIEDIDCSLDLTGKRKTEKEAEDEESSTGPTPNDKETRKITLSGILNFIDGIWSACGGERIVVFTTNHVEKLDPALIRRGRMDKHIHLSYCGFEAFKVLAKNYLDLDDHSSFETIRALLEEVKMTPADVVEQLMPKSLTDDCLGNLIRALESAKDEAKEEAEVKAKPNKRWSRLGKKILRRALSSTNK